MPSADGKTITMSGPWRASCSKKIESASSAAKAGMIQTFDSRKRRRGVIEGSGKPVEVGSGISRCVHVRIPQQSRIEGAGGEHGEDGGGGEERHARSRAHRHD